MLQMIGLTSFSKLNIIIGVNDVNVKYWIQFVCKSLNNSKIKHLLSIKNIMISENHQTCYGTFEKEKNKFSFKTTNDILDLNKPLVEYLERKSSWVLDRKRVKDLIDIPSINTSNVLIIGRRILTRGHNPINESSLIQSYDYKTDMDHRLIEMILKKFLKLFKNSITNFLIVIENYPNQISYIISRDEELKTLLHGNVIALACIEPDTKDIYTFEGNQFIQKSLKHIY